MTEEKLTIQVRNAPRYAAYDYVISLIDAIGALRSERKYKSSRGARVAVERLIEAGHTLREGDWDKIGID